MGSQVKPRAGDLSKWVSVAQAAGSPITAQRGVLHQPRVDRGTKPTDSPALMFWVEVIWFFLSQNREQRVLTVTRKRNLAGDRVMDCLGWQWFVFYSAHPPHGEKNKDEYVPYMLPVHAVVLFPDRQWETAHQSHRISLTVFPFDPEARHFGHFDSKLDTGDQSSPMMPPLLRAKQLVH